jgi:hypothetical protein
MGLLSKIFKKSTSSDEKVGGMEDFMSLIRVYYQAVMASNLGISNINALPDLRVFKQTLHVPTVNNKLGIGEKNRCKKMLIEIYGISDDFFKEIDNSIKKNCRNVNDVRNYLFLFQGFSQDLMMLVGNLMKWKFRTPSFLRSALKTFTEKTIHDILNKDTWKDEGVWKACLSIRKYQQTLGYTAPWMSEYVYNIILLAKKEPKQKPSDEKK